MTDYIKVIFRGETYGSIRAPTTLALLCSVFRVSPRASPILMSLDKSPLAISDLSAPISSGLYELISRRDVPFDPELDPSPHLHLPRVRLRKAPEKVDDSPSHSHSSNPQFPIPESEMAIAIQAMLHVIGSIPPRYLKYNVVLSNQIEASIDEVERMQKMLADLKTAEPNELDQAVRIKTRGKSKIPLTHGIHITFFQYRILNVLYEAWKLVWRRATPFSRYFRLTDIKVLHSIDVAEHYLNLLNSWRRVLESDTYSELEKSFESLRPVDEGQNAASKSKVYKAPTLPSEKHPRAWQYLVRPLTSNGDRAVLQDLETPRTVLDPNTVLTDFRKMFMDGITSNSIYKTEELNVMLSKMMDLDRQARQSAHPGETLQYPSRAVRSAIQREFRLSSK